MKSRTLRPYVPGVFLSKAHIPFHCVILAQAGVHLFSSVFPAREAEPGSRIPTTPLSVRFFPLFLSFTIFFLGAFFLFSTPSVHAAITMKPATTTGLIGWWSFDEGTSTVAGDYSSSRYSGTLRNGTLWSSGKRGTAINMDGSNDYIEVPYAIPLNYTGGNLSLSAWIYPDSTETDGSHIFSKPWNGGGQYNYRISYDSGGNVSVNLHGATTYGYQTTQTLPRGQWSLVTVTLTSSQGVNIYFNGQLVASQTHPITDWTPSSGNASLPLCIGTLYPYGEGWVGVSGFSLDGKIDDARIYNQVLTATEVAGLYKAGEAVRKIANKNGLIAYWPMNEGTSTLAGDFSNNGNTGTLATGVSWGAGKKGGTAIFNGTTGKITTTSAVSVPTTMTVSAWIYKNAGTGQKSFFSNRDAGGGAVYVGLTGNTQVFVYDNNGSPAGVTTAVGSVAIGQWQHISVTSDGLFLKIYVNGTLIQTTSQTRTASAGLVGIGWDPALATEFWDGKIDDVRVYNRALSSEEIKSLYQSNETKMNAPQDTKLTTGLVGYWTFNGKDINGSTALDVSGQNNHGTFASTQLTIGKIGQGMVFNGTASLMTLNSSISLSGGAWTIATWFKYPLAASGSWNTLTRGSVADHQVIISSGGILGTYDNTVSGFVSSGYDMAALASTAGWHHLTAVGSGSATSFYIDGVLVGSSAFKSTSQISYVGNYQGGTQQFGTIDDVRIYMRALSAAEAKQLYSMGK